MGKHLEEYLCGFSIVSAEEAFVCFICAVLGFVFTQILAPSLNRLPNAAALRQSEAPGVERSTSLRYSEAPKSELQLWRPAAIAACPFVSTLPVDITSLLTTFVDLADIAQLCAASCRARDGFWHPYQVWAELSIARGLKCSEPLLAAGVAADRFRQMFFGIADDRPRALLTQARKGCTPAAQILEETAHMLRGVMPQDDRSTLHCVLESAADAIWLHETWDDKAVRAVEAFFQVARRRVDLLYPPQLEHLEDCLSAAQRLDESMESAMQKALADYTPVELEDLGEWADIPSDDVFRRRNVAAEFLRT